MSFDHPTEILSHPLHLFSKNEKQLAMTALIVLLWRSWETNCEEWIEAGDINMLYIGTLQREQALVMLLGTDIGVYGKA